MQLSIRSQSASLGQFIDGYGNYGKLVNGKPVYDPAGPFISKSIVVS